MFQAILNKLLEVFQSNHKLTDVDMVELLQRSLHNYNNRIKAGAYTNIMYPLDSNPARKFEPVDADDLTKTPPAPPVASNHS